MKKFTVTLCACTNLPVTLVIGGFRFISRKRTFVVEAESKKKVLKTLEGTSSKVLGNINSIV